MASHGMTTDKRGLPDFIASATACITYVTDPEIWPQFIAWMTTNHPDAGTEHLPDQREIVARHALDLLHAWSGAN